MLLSYSPFGLTHHQKPDRNLSNKYLFNGGSEWQNEFELNLHMTPNRMLDPALGRFWGIDALSDLMPSISPMAYGYNNPMFFNDPLGLAGVPGCDECEGTVLDEVVVTASRLPQIDYSFLFNSYNPVYRNLGLRAKNNDREYIQQAFNQSPIQYGEGLGYQTQFMQGLNTIGNGISSSLVYASFGTAGAVLVAYGSPVLFGFGKFSLSASGISMATELTSQTVVNSVALGNVEDGLMQTDILDVFVVGTPLKFVGSSLIGSFFNYTPVGGFSTPESTTNFSTDLTSNLISGGQDELLKKSNIGRTTTIMFNLWNQTKTKAIGTTINIGLKNDE